MAIPSKSYHPVLQARDFRKTNKINKLQSSLSRLDLANTAELLAEMARREYVVFPKSRIINEQLTWTILKTTMEIRSERKARERKPSINSSSLNINNVSGNATSELSSDLATTNNIIRNKQ